MIFEPHDVLNGQCAIINDGEHHELRFVLDYIFPDDSGVCGNFKFYFLNKHVSDKKYFDSSNLTDLPTQSVKIFYKQIKDIIEQDKKVTFTIEDWKEGKCLILHDGSSDELNTVLKHVYPNTYPSLGRFKYYISTGNDWVNVRNNDEVPALPVQSIKLFLNQINKKMREITWQQGHQIIDSACPSWKEDLSKKWGYFIAIKENIQISEEFYKLMRTACTTEQHKLFDKIFGAECPYKDGEAILVHSPTSDQWLLRYSNGRLDVTGEALAYCFQKKTGPVDPWKFHMKLDLNNLPINIE